MMAGKKTVATTNSVIQAAINQHFPRSTQKSSSQSESSSKEEETISIPPVMIANTDGKELSRILSYINKKSYKRAFVRVKSDVIPMAVDNEQMGYPQYPKVRTADLFIAVASKSEWGVILTQAPPSKEWSIYVLLKQEMRSPFNGNLVAKTVGGQMVATPRIFTTNAVEMYASEIVEKCPRTVSVSASSHQVTVANDPLMQNSFR